MINTNFNHFQVYRPEMSIKGAMKLNLEQCDQCNGIGGCINDLQIYCTVFGADHTDYYYTSTRCASSLIDNHCGCHEFISGATVTNELSILDDQCYSTSDPVECEPGEDCVYHCGYGISINGTIKYGSCDGLIVDGTAASSLTVICDENAICQGMKCNCIN